MHVTMCACYCVCVCCCVYACYFVYACYCLCVDLKLQEAVLALLVNSSHFLAAAENGGEGGGAGCRCSV